MMTRHRRTRAGAEAATYGWACIAVFLLAAAAGAEDRGEAGGEPVDADRELITLRPDYIHLNYSIQLRQGNGQSQGNLSVRLGGWLEDDLSVVGYRFVSMGDWVTSMGEKLDARLPDQITPVQLNQHRGGDQPDLSFSLQSSAPGRSARWIDETEAVVDLYVSQGPLRRAVLSPWSDFRGRRLRIETIDSPVTLSMERENWLDARFEGDTVMRLHELRFRDGEGRDIPTSGGGSSSGTGWASRRFGVNLPDDATIELRFWSSVETVRARVRVPRIPLPGFDSSLPELAVASEVVGAEGPGGHEAMEGDLEVVVE